MAVTTLVEVVKSGGGDLEKRELSKSDMGRGSCVFVFRSSSSNEQRGRTVRVREKKAGRNTRSGKKEERQYQQKVDPVCQQRRPSVSESMSGKRKKEFLPVLVAFSPAKLVSLSIFSGCL